MTQTAYALALMIIPQAGPATAVMVSPPIRIHIHIIRFSVVLKAQTPVIAMTQAELANAVVNPVAEPTVMAFVGGNIYARLILTITRLFAWRGSLAGVYGNGCRGLLAKAIAVKVLIIGKSDQVSPAVGLIPPVPIIATSVSVVINRRVSQTL